MLKSKLLPNRLFRVVVSIHGDDGIFPTVLILLAYFMKFEGCAAAFHAYRVDPIGNGIEVDLVAVNGEAVLEVDECRLEFVEGVARGHVDKVGSDIFLAFEGVLRELCGHGANGKHFFFLLWLYSNITLNYEK